MATVEALTSETVAANKARRRDTNTSTSSDDDVKAIGALHVSIEGESGTPAATTTSSTPKSTNDAGSSSSSRLNSLRSLLGVPSSNGSSRPFAGQSSGNLLGVPPSTTAKTAPVGIGGAPGGKIRTTGGESSNGELGRSLLTSEIAPKRKKVVLEPGCSALDWAQKKQEIAAQRARSPGGLRMQRITRAQLKQHATLDDAWSAINGKVYDMTPYLRFHPGGQQELMRVAGRDGTRLFMLTHSWVNVDAMIDACCVGILVSES